jgi:hypothetical protein
MNEVSTNDFNLEVVIDISNFTASTKENWNYLPKEIKLHILSHLSASELAWIAPVSKEFYGLIRHPSLPQPPDTSSSTSGTKKHAIILKQEQNLLSMSHSHLIYNFGEGIRYFIIKLKSQRGYLLIIIHRMCS